MHATATATATVGDSNMKLVEVEVRTSRIARNGGVVRKLLWSVVAILFDYVRVTDDVMGATTETKIIVRDVSSGRCRVESYLDLGPKDIEFAKEQLIARFDGVDRSSLDDFLDSSARIVDWSDSPG